MAFFDIPAARMIFSAVDRSLGPAKSALKNLKWFRSESNKELKKAGQASMKFGTGLGAAAATVAGATLSARGDTEDALGGLASMGIKNLDALEAAARRFSNDFSRVSRAELLDAAYDIKSGISSLSDDGVADMTRLAAMTGVATKATTGQMTELYAQSYNIYGKQFKTSQAFGQAFSAGLSEAVQRFRTDGKQMAGAIANIQAIPTNMGVGMSEQLAVVGMLRNTFKSGEEAGTAYKGVMLKLGEAGQKLGTKFTDANGKALSMVQIIRKLEHAQKGALAKGQGAEFQQALKNAFGEDGIKMLSAFMGKSADLQKHITGITEASKKGEAHTRTMAMAMEKGANRSAARFANQLGNLSDVVGKALSPGFQEALAPLGRMLKGMQAWAVRNPGMIRSIGAVIGVLSGLAIGIGAVTLATWAWNTSIAATARTIIKGLVKALAWAIPAVLKFSAALLANPFALVVVGIAAVVAGIYIFRNEIAAAWNWVKGITQVAWNAIVGTLSGAWEGIRAGLAGIWKNIKAGFETVISWLSPDLLVEAGMGLINGLWNGIKAVWARMTGWAKKAIKGLTSWIPFVGGDDDEDEAKEAVAGSSAGRPGRGAPVPEQILRQAHETRVRAESKTRIELDLKNAPGLAVSRVDKSGDDIDLAMAGANFGGAY